MAVSCRFSPNMEVIINFSMVLQIKATFSQIASGGSSFSSKVKIRGMSSRLLEYVTEDAA